MSGIYTQSRSLDFNPAFTAWYSPSSAKPERSTVKIPGSQVTTSYRSGALGDRLEAETPDARFLMRSSAIASQTSVDTGHGFYSRSQWLDSISHPKFEWKSDYNMLPGNTRHFSGALVIDASPWAQVYPNVPKLSASAPGAEVHRMFGMAIPTKPEFGLSTALAELLSEGLPFFQRSVLHNIAKGRDHDPTIKDLASDYLALEFGVKPLVSDVLGLVRTLKKASAVLRQYDRDNGKRVRRRVKLPIIETQSDVFIAQPYLPIYGEAGSWMNNMGWLLDGDVKATATTKTQWWFSGAFQYYIPTDKDVMSRIERYEQMGNHLLGTRLSADVFWNLTPWSWLVDWVSCVGQSLSNVVAFQSDGLVMPYGYVMRRTRITTRVSCTLVNRSNPALRLNVWNDYHVDQKERVHGTPYGFGLDLRSFTARQWAILGALGLTLAPGSLRLGGQDTQ